MFSELEMINGKTTHTTVKCLWSIFLEWVMCLCRFCKFFMSVSPFFLLLLFLLFLILPFYPVSAFLVYIFSFILHFSYHSWFLFKKISNLFTIRVHKIQIVCMCCWCFDKMLCLNNYVSNEHSIAYCCPI